MMAWTMDSLKKWRSCGDEKYGAIKNSVFAIKHAFINSVRKHLGPYVSRME